MPSKSEHQQKAAGMALAAKRGELDPNTLQGPARQMYDDMDEKQLRDFAKTKHDNIPAKVEEGTHGPTRMQIQKHYDGLKGKYSTERQRLNDLEKAFNISNVKTNSKGDVVSYSMNEGSDPYTTVAYSNEELAEATPKGFSVGQKVKSKHMPNVDLWVQEVPKGKDYVFVVDKKGHENKMKIDNLKLAESKTFAPVLDMLNEISLGKKDKDVINAFTDHVPMEGNKLRTDGQKLDGIWMGGDGIAHWNAGRIYFNDLGSKSAQQVQSAIKKIVPKYWIMERKLASGKDYYVVTYLNAKGKEVKDWVGAKSQGEAEREAHSKLRDQPDVRKIISVVKEATSSMSLDYEKHGSRTTPAPAIRDQVNFGSGSDEMPEDEDVMDPYEIDPEHNDGKTIPRNEACMKDEDKLIDPEEAEEELDEGVGLGSDDQWEENTEEEKDEISDEELFADQDDSQVELGEAKFTFKPNQSITYRNKSWTVKKSTKDWVELEDKRGFSTIVDFDDIKTFKNGTLMVEMDETLMNEEVDRMRRMVNYDE